MGRKTVVSRGTTQCSANSAHLCHDALNSLISKNSGSSPAVTRRARPSLLRICGSVGGSELFFPCMCRTALPPMSGSLCRFIQATRLIIAKSQLTNSMNALYRPLCALSTVLLIVCKFALWREHENKIVFESCITILYRSTYICNTERENRYPLPTGQRAAHASCTALQPYTEASRAKRSTKKPHTAQGDALGRCCFLSHKWQRPLM